MSYENSAATKFVATHCGVCGRPLVDAESVSAGIGPICADKYGLDRNPTGTTDFEKSLKDISNCRFTPINKYFEAVSNQDCRGAANALIYTISAIAGQLEFTDVSMNPDLRYMADSIESLGYIELSNIIRERLDGWVEKNIKKAKIKVTKVGNVYEVISPYSQRFVESIHNNCPGNRWVPYRKVRQISVDQKMNLIAALSTAYPCELMVFDGMLDRVPFKMEEAKKPVENNSHTGYEEF